MTSGRYARVLSALAESDNSAQAHQALERLIEHLKRHGRIKLLPSMVRELKRLAERKTVLAPAVEVAHQRDAKEALVAAKEAGVAAAHATVNHKLLSGWRAHADGHLIDRSGKGALVSIYQKVIG